MIRDRVENAMRSSSVGLTPHILLSALSAVYGTGVGLRNFLYSSGAFKTHRLPCRVISVGNITVGGTGKTPIAIFIAGLLKGKGYKTVILSRGYGGKAQGPALVSDGRQTLLSPDIAGDEPCLMAARLPGVPVIVSPDRVKGGLFAIEKFSPDFIILDDGFQHRRLERDINIVLIDSKEGFGNGYLLPRGILREPLEGLRRANLVLIKGGEPDGEVKETLKKYDIPAMTFDYSITGMAEVASGSPKKLSDIKGTRALAFAGLANPDSFFSAVETLGVEITKKLKYPDHHPYAPSDIETIKANTGNGGIAITTEKDAVKLKALAGAFPLYALRIEARLDEKGFEGLLSSRLGKLK